MNEARGAVSILGGATDVWTPFEIFRDLDPQVGGYLLWDGTV